LVERSTKYPAGRTKIEDDIMTSGLKQTIADFGLHHCRGNRQSRNRALLRRFAQREDGSLLVLGLMLFVLMVMMGGLAVDLMRYEDRRTELQQTLDRSVLAAAALSQQLDPEDVVNDYFAKAGLSQYLNGVTAETGLNYRTVTASAQSTVKPFFLHMMGIDELTAGAGSGAEQRISNVEISLVLDISGSMSGSRINNLRPAAREFVTSVLGNSEPGRISISIVPYNAQVNIGRPMMNAFNVNAIQNRSSCIELPDWTFNSIDLSTTTSFPHNSHFDPYRYTSGSSNMLYNCPPQTGNQVTPLSDNVVALHAAINSLFVDGNTSIDVGVKWGAYLLNRNAGPVIKNLIAANRVDSKFADRPLDQNVASVLKVLVVMTDGQNTTEYKIRNPYNTGNSNIWRRSNGTMSVYFDRSGSNDWWWPRNNSWNSSRDGGNSNYTQLTWQQVWEDFSVTYVAYHFYGLALNQNYRTWENNFMESVWSNKNQRLQSVCSAAKATGIVVYGIGFEAPLDGRDQVRACASTPSHYFDAQGLEISTAFRAIANNISQLRLTQ
jgi:Flp pilus assembly protein TadG